MEGGLFTFLDGISPWWWVAAAAALGAAEMATFTYFLIWPAAAALLTALILGLAPELSGGAQLTWFAGLSLALGAAGYVAMPYLRPAEAPTLLNRRASSMVGRSGVALADFQAGEGVVIIDDVRWTATLEEGEAEAGDRLTVIAAQGSRLTCRPA